MSPVFKSRVYKLVGYVPYEIPNSKKVRNLSFAPIGSHSCNLPLKFANLGLKYWGQLCQDPWLFITVNYVYIKVSGSCKRNDTAPKYCLLGSLLLGSIWLISQSCLLCLMSHDHSELYLENSNKILQPAPNRTLTLHTKAFICFAL
jgi:hypothetical protein